MIQLPLWYIQFLHSEQFHECLWFSALDWGDTIAIWWGNFLKHIMATGLLPHMYVCVTTHMCMTWFWNLNEQQMLCGLLLSPVCLTERSILGISWQTAIYNDEALKCLKVELAAREEAKDYKESTILVTPSLKFPLLDLLWLIAKSFCASSELFQVSTTTEPEKKKKIGADYKLRSFLSDSPRCVYLLHRRR